MTVYLVRHAKAGDRASWSGEDFQRPLTRRGQLQAEGLLTQFEGLHIDRLLSSPYIRCIESLVPLSGERLIPVEPVEPLTEGARLEEALTLLRKHTHHDVVMCSHGDVIPMLLEHFSSRGLDLGRDPVCPKGCTWVLEVDGAQDIVSARYIAPPPDRDDTD